jgi:hypothetical protein
MKATGLLPVAIIRKTNSGLPGIVSFISHLLIETPIRY